METVEILGYRRQQTGKKQCNSLRNSANAPAVVYGYGIHENIYVPMSMLKKIIYTPNVYFVDLNLEGEHYKCMLQDVQFHPVSEVILHVDFFKFSEEKSIKMMIPVVLDGVSKGVQSGGILVQNVKKIPVTALPSEMPDKIKIDITNLEAGRVIRVSEVEQKNFVINAIPGMPLVGVNLSRAMKVK